MNNDGLYHQPRWVNAIVIAGCVPVILSQYVMPKGLSQAFVLLAVPLLFLFVGICNRVRSGAFFPRWAERKRIAERLDSENARRISEAELAVIEREVSACDTKPRSLHLLCKAVLHIAAKLEITFVKIGFSRAICARIGQSNFALEQELLVSKYATANMSVLPAMLRSRVKARSILRRSHRRLLGTSPAIRSVQRVSVRSISLYQVGEFNLSAH